MDTEKKFVKQVECVCFKRCQMRENPDSPYSARLFDVGEKWVFPSDKIHKCFTPMKHSKENIVDNLRRQLDELKVGWDKRWDVDRMVREIEAANQRNVKQEVLKG